MGENTNKWSVEAIEEAARIFCCGIPLPEDGEPDLHKAARGKCAGPYCPCWEDGKRVVTAALNAAAKIEINRTPVCE